MPPHNINSELCVPLIYDAKVVGVLDIQSDRRNTFTEDDLMIFEAVADNIATAVHNADLYRSEQWRRQVGESLREVAGLISENVGKEKGGSTPVSLFVFVDEETYQEIRKNSENPQELTLRRRNINGKCQPTGREDDEPTLYCRQQLARDGTHGGAIAQTEHGLYVGLAGRGGDWRD